MVHAPAATSKSLARNRKWGARGRELKRVKDGRLFLIPASEETRGHLATGSARFWKQQVQELLLQATGAR